MLKTVEGIYQNGKVELTEQPQTTGDRVQVLVTFLNASTVDPNKLRQLIDQLETIAGLQRFRGTQRGSNTPGNKVKPFASSSVVSSPEALAVMLC